MINLLGVCSTAWFVLSRQYWIEPAGLFFFYHLRATKSSINGATNMNVV